MDYEWNFQSLVPYFELLAHGLGVTLAFTITTVCSGLIIGCVLGMLRIKGSRWINIPIIAYIELFRCTPLLVLLMWMYYALPSLVHIEMPPVMACHLTLSLYAGSFYAEIFRGGIEAISQGQWNAGKALGLPQHVTFTRIILPQATRIMIPSFINQTVIQIKNTALVSTIAVGDLLHQGSVIASAIYQPLEVYTVIAVLYFAMLFPLTLVARHIEKRLKSFNR